MVGVTSEGGTHLKKTTIFTYFHTVCTMITFHDATPSTESDESMHMGSTLTAEPVLFD